MQPQNSFFFSDRALRNESIATPRLNILLIKAMLSSQLVSEFKASDVTVTVQEVWQW